MPYESPQLPLSEIISYFRTNLNLNISEVDFKKPNAKKWREVYSVIFEILTHGRSIDQAVQRLQAAMRRDASNPRFFEEAFGQMAFANCMGRVLHGCGFPDFSIKTVLQPSPADVHRVCSVFLNRLRWDLGVAEHFEETLERMKKAQGQSQSVLNRNKELRRKLEEIAEPQATLDAQIEQAKEEYESMNSRKDEIGKELEEEKRKKTDGKLRLAEMQTKKENANQAISNVRQECDRLSSKIVQSPRKFKMEQERLQKRVCDMKADLERKDQTLLDGKVLFEQTMAKEHAGEKALKMVSEVLSDMEQENEVDQDMKRLSDGQREVQEHLNAINAQEEDLVEMLALRHQQKYQKASQADIRNQSKWQQLNDLKQHREKLGERLKTLKQEASHVSSQASAYKEKEEETKQRLHDKESEHQEEIKGFMEEAQMLEQMFETGMADLVES